MNPLHSLKSPGISASELWLVVGVMGFFLFLLISLALYLRYQRRRSLFQHFKMLYLHRGLDEKEMRCLFRFVEKRGYDPQILLESQKVAHEAIVWCGLDEGLMMKKLGFDTQSMIHDFLKRQEELRKKWNAK